MARGGGIATAEAGAENAAFQAGVLSLVAGYADTLGYLSFGAFAGLMTGNTVLLGIALAQRADGDTRKEGQDDAKIAQCMQWLALRLGNAE